MINLLRKRSLGDEKTNSSNSSGGSISKGSSNHYKSSGARSPRKSVHALNPSLPFLYSRPSFLQLSETELASALDTNERHILTNRSRPASAKLKGTNISEPELVKSSSTNSSGGSGLSLSSSASNLYRVAGYAEMINGGKSSYNEDFAVCDENFAEGRCLLYGVFDGHGGWEVAKYAGTTLPKLLEERISDIGSSEFPEHLVTAAIEASFFEMDELTVSLKSGCTALVALFTLQTISKKFVLHVANAGDSKAVISKKGKAQQLTKDHVPVDLSEMRRMMNVAYYRPEVLGDIYRRGIFVDDQLRPRAIKAIHVGERLGYIDAHLSSSILSTVTTDDVTKQSLVSGDGKGKSLKVMGKIGTTRGFGDFNLMAFGSTQSSPIYVKPLLTPVPDVFHCDLSLEEFAETDSLVLGSESLWDSIPKQTAVDMVTSVLREQMKEGEEPAIAASRAAQKLVEMARDFSGDDVTVFVIPLAPLLKVK
eukprot:TRINITY_DN1740_c0_g2_i1.p1 TRINITY_DN1740_c0_g2~~TRINITY_DN1740_c0_g2_i1.p1  ORF type:complete len:479 (+),score=101.04 TRINITY_DN1740_c0_g2_i1:316-1752(+)